MPRIGVSVLGVSEAVPTGSPDSGRSAQRHMLPPWKEGTKSFPWKLGKGRDFRSPSHSSGQDRVPLLECKIHQEKDYRTCPVPRGPRPLPRRGVVEAWLLTDATAGARVTFCHNRNPPPSSRPSRSTSTSESEPTNKNDVRLAWTCPAREQDTPWGINHSNKSVLV